MTSTASRLAAAVLLVGLAGCTVRARFTGNTLTPPMLLALDSLTTKSQVLTALGPPRDVQLRIDGSAFVYRFEILDDANLNLSMFNATLDVTIIDRRADRLWILFDKQGGLERWGFARSEEVEAEPEELPEEG